MCRMADRANHNLPLQPRQICAPGGGPWFKTTNAHRAQPAALRHKRALKTLLGKAAATIMVFMGRNGRPPQRYTGLLKHPAHAGPLGSALGNGAWRSGFFGRGASSGSISVQRAARRAGASPVALWPSAEYRRNRRLCLTSFAGWPRPASINARLALARTMPARGRVNAKAI